jgi:transcription antitermination factor NusG
LKRADVTDHDSRNHPGWYALYTRHQHEKVVAHALTNRGFQVFLPLSSVAHQWKDRKKQLSLPLFPCYVFLSTSLSRTTEILRTPGVYQFVGFGGAASAIPAEEIEALKRAMESDVPLRTHPFLNRGDRVRVKHGALAGVEGILIRHKNQCQLILSVEILKRSVAVEMEMSRVEKLPPEITAMRPTSPAGAMTFSPTQI